MTNTPTPSNLGLHYSAVALYVIAVVIFLIARAKGSTLLAEMMVLVLVVGPAGYYPIVYFALKWRLGNGHDYAQHLAGIWGPLWAALAVLWVYLLVERWPVTAT